MYYRDHSPPHFHAIYNEDEAIIEIGTGAVLDGQLPHRALNLVLDWEKSHRQELNANWMLARSAQPLSIIAPLD
jgi:hypothetical protein